MRRESGTRRIQWPATALDRAAQLKVAGGLAAVTFAAVVYSQFNLYNELSRDSSIYIYGGQRLTHGVPPYASIMDPKGPMPSILCGFGVAVARLFGRNDVLMVRAEFCALSILSVLGIYLLVLELWHSVVAGVVAAAVFTSFKTYAHAALAAPEGHTPGVVFLIFAMWLTVRKRWYWAGFAASLAFLSWQPMLAYPVIVFLCAVVWSPGRRLRAVGWNLAGCATPLATLIIYYAAEGYPGKLFEGLFVFPLTGVRRPPKSIGRRLPFIFDNTDNSFGNSAILLWAGLSLLIIAAVWTVVSARSAWRAALAGPIVLLVVLSLLTQAGYVVYDYIGWTHAFPLLPYAAVGFGAGTAYLLQRVTWSRARQAASVAFLAAATALVATYAVVYYQPSDPTGLNGEQASACAIQRSLVPGTLLWTLGNPIPLVLLHRHNPDNYPYLGSGLDVWKVKHTPGGFDGWTSQIARASIVVEDAWRGPMRPQMRLWLHTHGYRYGYIGHWKVYATAAARARMAALSITMTRLPNIWPQTPSGRPIRATHCTNITAG